jgi:hypothetical protein
MISSPEFFLSAGGTNDGYIRQLYLRLLGRQADDSGLAYWTGHLNSGDMGRADVVLSFQFSDENRRLLIGDWYEQFLGRSPSTVESNLFLAQLQQGASQRQVQMYLIDSLEYRNSPAPPAAGAAVRLLS